MVCKVLSAAFNTVNLDILMAVLEIAYGVKGNVLNWCDSYLMKSMLISLDHREAW